MSNGKVKSRSPFGRDGFVVCRKRRLSVLATGDRPDFGFEVLADFGVDTEAYFDHAVTETTDFGRVIEVFARCR